MLRSTYELLRIVIPFGLAGVGFGAVAGGIGGAVMGAIAGAITQAYTGSPVLLSYAYTCGGIGAALFGVVGLVVAGVISYSVMNSKVSF